MTGGVAMINHALSELWTGEEKHDLLMHDWYLGLLASAFGNLVYIDEPTELYRQHSSNVLGARTLRKRMKNWVRPISFLPNIGVLSKLVKIRLEIC